LKINFTTNNIDQKLYEKSALTYIYDHYLFDDYSRIMQQDKWEINVRKLTDFQWNFYDKEIKNLSKGIPHGVTGDNVIQCYVNDENNRMYYMQNMMVICHELSHMILKIYYPKERGILLYDDVWGRAGDERNFFSTEIHNRVHEGRTRKFKAFHLNKEYYFYGVDIDDITNKRNLNNGF
jgi:hypothetical protein